MKPLVMDQPDSSGDLPRSRLDLLLPLLLGMCIARLWLMPLPSSFWVDEMGTAFVVRNGPSHPSLVAPQVWESIYYFLPRAADALFGFSEVAYRLPSVLAMAIALFLIARLAARLVHPQASWFAVFACLALGGINYEAADARPYALGICVAAATLLFLVRWLESAGWGDALLFVGFAALLWRVHLLYWPLYMVFALYCLVRLVRSETRVGWLRAGGMFALLGLALGPVLLDALVLLREASAHVFVPVPSYRDLFNSFKLGLVAVGGWGAWLFNMQHTADIGARFFGLQRARRSLVPKNAGDPPNLGLSRANRWLQRPPHRISPSWASLTLILGWWLLHPLCLFAYSRLSGNSVFVDRYLSVALPGTALAATVMAGLYIPPARWKQMSLLLGAGALLLMGQWQDLLPPHDNSDWRAAVRQIHELRLAPETPVICPSPFIEAQWPAWQPDYRLPGFLYAHLDTYPIPGKPYLFPIASSPEGERFAMTLSQATLPAAGRFVIYGGEPIVSFWRLWFARRSEFSGWRHRNFGPFGNIEVVLFENPDRN